MVVDHHRAHALRPQPDRLVRGRVDVTGVQVGLQAVLDRLAPRRLSERRNEAHAGVARQGTDRLSDLFGSLAEPYVMQRATGWVMRNATLMAIRKLKGTTGDRVGSDFVTDGPADASGAMIGKPAHDGPLHGAHGQWHPL